MKIKDIGVIMAVALAAGGCNQNDEGLQQEGRVPILLRASVDDAAKGLTRAATAKTTQDTELIDGQRVDAYIKVTGGNWLDNGTKPLQYRVDGNSGNLEPVSSSEPARYYPVDLPYKISIYAVHPSYTSDDSFSVATDQTDEDNYAVSDLCYSKTADYGRQSGRQTLTFKHVLSKIVVNLTTNRGATLPSTIKLQAKKTTTMTYPTGSGDDCSVPAEATGDVATFTMGLTSDGTTSSGAIVIPPQTVSAGTSFISFTVDGIGPMYYPLPASTTFESGKRYTYNIKVNNTGITVTTDVNDWGTKVANETVMGKKSKKMLNPLWYVAEYNLKADGTFDKTESTSQGYLFQWDMGTYSAMGSGFAATTGSTYGYDGYLLPNPAKTVSNGEIGVTWHLPTVKEWFSIVPVVYSSSTNYKHIFGTSLAALTVVEDQPCTFGYSNDTKYSNKMDNTSNEGVVYKSYWSTYSAGSNLRYAIRFIGTEYCSVWKYQILDYNTTSSRLVISSRLITPIAASNVTALSDMMTTITQNTFDWSENENIGAIQREFYFVGFASSSEGNAPGTASGKRGLFWASLGSSTNSNWAWNMTIGNTTDYFCMRVDSEGRSNGRPIRLFRDN